MPVAKELTAWQTLETFLVRHWLWLSAVGTLLLAPVCYWLFASSVPVAALIGTSLLAIALFAFLVALVWRMEPKITWQRRLEVFGYRAGVGLVIYAGVGYGLLLLLNSVTGQLVPIETTDQALRRLPFWPFYALAVAGCHSFLPIPPGMPC